MAGSFYFLLFEVRRRSRSSRRTLFPKPMSRVAIPEKGSIEAGCASSPFGFDFITCGYDTIQLYKCNL